MEAVKKTTGVISSILVAAAALLAAAMLLAKIAGAGSFIIQSGSMEPAYHTGSLIFDKKIRAEELNEGDVITFVIADNMTATHRITDIKTDDSGRLWFTTKGDANETEDASPVSTENVLGSPVFQIPYLGYLVEFVRKPPGLYVSIAFVVLLLALSFLR